MDIDADALADELKMLRKGRATRHPAMPRRLGPQTWALCGIVGTDGPAAARAKLMDTVGSLLKDESKQTWLAVVAALALHPETDQRDLAARERWLADQLRCHERTARRRVDEAFAILVQQAAHRQADPGDRGGQEPWQVQATRSFLRLDGPGPEIIEHRTILVTRGSVGEILCRFSLPRHPDVPEEEHDLIVELLHGGQIRHQDRPSREHFRYLVQLPRKFHEGETHEYTVRLRLPAGQPMAPHYVLQPLLPVKSFGVKVRFDLARLPSSIWRLNGVPPRMIDVDHDERELLRADRFGELQLEFRNLRQGFAYGLSWA